MPMYKISILGLYQYSDTLFDKLVLPVFPVPNPAPSNLFIPDKDTLVSVILERSADFPALYPHFEFMQYIIGVWSKNTAYMMVELYRSMNIKYNPGENYDRYSDITRSGSSSGGGTVTGSRTSFNSDDFKDTDKSVSSNSSSGSETVSDHTHGNIGVRSTQELIEQSREIASFKWYDAMADDFINKFCIQIF